MTPGTHDGEAGRLSTKHNKGKLDENIMQSTQDSRSTPPLADE